MRISSEFNGLKYSLNTSWSLSDKFNSPVKQNEPALLINQSASQLPSEKGGGLHKGYLGGGITTCLNLRVSNPKTGLINDYK